MTQYPFVPLRDIVVFPGQETPLFVGRDLSVAAVTASWNSTKLLAVATQVVAANPKVSTIEDVAEIGCVVEIIQYQKLPDGPVKALIRGVRRIQLTALSNSEEFLQVTAHEFEAQDAQLLTGEQKAELIEAAAFLQYRQNYAGALRQAKSYVETARKLTADGPRFLLQNTRFASDAEFCGAALGGLIANVADKQKLLELRTPDQLFSIVNQWRKNFESAKELIEFEIAQLEQQLGITKTSSGSPTSGDR